MRFGLACLGVVAVLTAATISASQGSSAKPAAPQSGSMAMGGKMTDADLIKSAMSAAPAAIAKGATVVTMDDKGGLRTVRQGTNGWTCMPDVPETPGPDPMCVDKNGMAWAMAWLQHKDPPADKIGFGYMLMGGSDASNTDPFATKPAAGQKWIATGPHVMVLTSAPTSTATRRPPATRQRRT